MDGPAGFLSNGARDEVRGDRRSGAATRSAGTARRIVGIAEGTAEGTARVRRSHLSKVRLGQNDRARFAQALDEGGVIRRAIVCVSSIHPRGCAHIERVVLVLDGE